MAMLSARSRKALTMVEVTHAMQESWNSQSDAINSWGELSGEEQINLATFYQAAIAEGRRQMREEAATVAEYYPSPLNDLPMAMAIKGVVMAISAIPIGDAT